MWQERLVAVQRRARRRAQIGMRSDMSELSTLDETVEDDRDLGTALGARPIMILSSNDDAADGAPGLVVVDGDRWILEEEHKPFPDTCRVAGCFADATLWQSVHVEHPSFDAIGVISTT